MARRAQHRAANRRYQQSPEGGRRLRASITDPYPDFIRRTLEQYPRLRATRVYQMIVSGKPGTSTAGLRAAIG